MTRRLTIWLPFISVLLFLTACSDNTDYPAKESHLENITFLGQQNSNNQFIFNEGQLTIMIDELMLKPDFGPADAAGKEKSEVVYHDIQIETDGDKYMITGSNNFRIELQRIGERILIDEDGQRYSTSRTLE